MSHFPLVIIDASVSLAAIFDDEPLHIQALGLLSELGKANAVLIAPPLWESETDSAIRLRVQFRKILAPTDEDAAHSNLDSLGIQIVYDPAIRLRARELAIQLGLNRVYDATYLALANLQGALFWTGDDKLFNAAAVLPFVRNLKNWKSGDSL